MHGLSFPAAVLSLAGLTVAATTPAANNPTVGIANGQLHGGNCAAPNQAVQYFSSIPYAQAPTGNLRFAPPKSYDTKYPGGSRQATAAPPSCPQFGGNWIEAGVASEDCLYLNVWKPANIAPNAKLPVRVFIHGGGNTAGGIADAMYDGCDVAHDTIMVAVNYRLGPLGFLALDPAAHVPGNQGIQDIVQALQWVQSNIGAFGGNPRQVVLHGQSAGAADAYAVATLDAAPKLMNGFVSESGAGRAIPNANETVLSTKDFAAQLKCNTNDVACFRGKSLADLMAAFGNSPSLHSDALVDATIPRGRFSFGAHVDGTIIPKQPYTQAVRVPAIFGVNSGDGGAFAEAYATGPKGLAGMTSKDYDTYLKYHFGDEAPAVAKQYPVSAYKKSQYPTFAAIAQIITDSAFLCPANRALNAAAAAKVPVWTYYFDHAPHCAWDSKGIPEKDRASMGAGHGAELPFVLGHTTSLPRGSSGNCQMTSAEQKISSFMKQSLTYFAANQKPVQNAAQWGAWTPQKLQGLHVTDTAQAAPLDYKLCQFWDGVWAKQEGGSTQSSKTMVTSKIVTTIRTSTLTTRTTTVSGKVTVQTQTMPATVTRTMTQTQAKVVPTSSTTSSAAKNVGSASTSSSSSSTTATTANAASTTAAPPVVGAPAPDASPSANASGKADPLQQNLKGAGAARGVNAVGTVAVVVGAMVVLGL